MSTPLSENSKLLLTAIAAATAGCAVSYLTLKSQTAKNTTKNHEDTDDPKAERNHSQTFIYEDSEKDGLRSTGSAAVLFPYNHEEKMRRRMAARVSVEDDNATPRRR